MRRLTPGESIPASQPTISTTSNGYTLLTWHAEQVSVLEHRVFGGRVVPPGIHVHHVDHDRTNNDPANLMLVTPAEHRALHAEGAGSVVGLRARGGASPGKPVHDHDTIERMFLDGQSQNDIARTLRVSPGWVSTVLTRRGHAPRQRPVTDEERRDLALMVSRGCYVQCWCEKWHRPRNSGTLAELIKQLPTRPTIGRRPKAHQCQ